MEIGERVKAIRKERGFRQYELAERAGLSSRTIFNVESGQIEPNLRTLNKIAIALGLKSVTQLMGK